MADDAPGTTGHGSTAGHSDSHGHGRDDEVPPSRLIRLLPAGLDCLIALYAVELCLIALTGGVTVGMMSLTGAAKPVLWLILLVPLRLTIGGESWLADLARTTVGRVARTWALLRPGVSPAVIDSAFAIAVVLAASVPAAFLANLVLEPARPPGFTLPFSNELFVEVFAAWDSGWYWDIATRGYYFRTDEQSSVAFFPLYPTLMRALAAPFGGGAGATWIAGIVLSMTSCVLALIALHRLTEQIFGSREVARRTVMYVVVFPWSLFLLKVYAESLFLLMSVLAISCAWNHRWWQAGLWGALATLARPNGILIGLPLALLALGDKPRARQLASRWLVLAPIPAAIIGYSAYVYTLSGDPLAWMSAQTFWDYSVGNPPWQQLQRVIAALLEHGLYGYFLMSDIAPIEFLQAASALIVLALTPAVFRRLGVAMGAYVLVSMLVPLSGSALEGLGRYASVLFPVFMIVGSMQSQRAYEAIVVGCVVFRTMLGAFFVTWQPTY